MPGPSGESSREFIDKVADEFEAAWKGGAPPRIVDFLNEAPADARRALLEELIRLDLEYRHKRGEALSLGPYQQELPELSAAPGLLPRLADAIRQLRPEQGLLPTEGTAPPREDRTTARKFIGERLFRLIAINGSSAGRAFWKICNVSRSTASARQFHDNPVKIAPLLQQIGWYRYEQGRFTEAEPLLRKAFDLFQMAPVREELVIENARSSLGRALLALKRYSEAEKLLRDALTKRTTSLGITATPTTRTAGALADLLEQTHRHEQAAQLRKKYALPVSATQPAH